MTNLATISLKERLKEFTQAASNVRKSLDSLNDKDGNYAEEHRHLINTYSTIIEILEWAIADSEIMGTSR